MKKNIKSSLFSIFFAAVLCFGVSRAAFADPPARVGRLSYTEGTVSFHTSDQNQWSPATLNYPVTTGTSYWTEPRSRAEIQVGSAEVRMNASTQLDFLHIDDQGTQVQLDQGTINVHLRRVEPGITEVATPVGNVDLVAAGSYHIEANGPDGAVRIAVMEGKAKVTGANSSLEVLRGEVATFSGNPVTYAIAQWNASDFDNWALSRERRERTSESALYVSPEETGYVDLDDYGHWSVNASYGTVWFPTTVVAGWAPYRYGHWAFVRPWGWTWIDAAPWGFAPFHYGRWVLVGGVWGWIPGAVVARPCYAPALVAFIGGPGWSISLSFGNVLGAIGWVPLGPREVFYPWYHVTPTYVRNVNIAYVNRTVINNITINRNVNNVSVNNFTNREAVTVVRRNDFTDAANVHRVALNVPREQLQQAHFAGNVAQLQPSRTARIGMARPEPAGAPPAVERPMTPRAFSPQSSQANRTAPEEQQTRARATPQEQTRSAETVQRPAAQEQARPQETMQQPVPQARTLPNEAVQRPAPAQQSQFGTRANESVKSSESAPSFAPAPGPPIRHGQYNAAAESTGTRQHASFSNWPPSSSPRVQASSPTIPHPDQQSRITPTPHGWYRVPVVNESQQQAPRSAPQPSRGSVNQSPRNYNTSAPPRPSGGQPSRSSGGQPSGNSGSHSGNGGSHGGKDNQH